MTKVVSRQLSQEVCPFNTIKFVQLTSEEAFWSRAGVNGEKMVDLMSLSQEEFSARFRRSPVKRAKRRGLLRNVAVALGNCGSPDAVPVLASALSDAEPLIRGHSAWALGRIASDGAVQALRGRLDVEEDAWVRDELELALEEAAGRSSPRLTPRGTPGADSR
jgi:epoxyqueuosine reductase